MVNIYVYYVYIYIYIYTNICTNIYMYIYIMCKGASPDPRPWWPTHHRIQYVHDAVFQCTVDLHLLLHLYMYTYICIHTYIYIYIYTYPYICLYFMLLYNVDTGFRRYFAASGSISTGDSVTSVRNLFSSPALKAESTSFTACIWCCMYMVLYVDDPVCKLFCDEMYSMYIMFLFIAYKGSGDYFAASESISTDGSLASDRSLTWSPALNPPCRSALHLSYLAQKKSPPRRTLQ